MEPTALPERPEPPEYLSADEQTLWREVVATKPADWFMRDTQPLLVAYCQCALMHRSLIKRWHDADPGAEVNGALVKLINETSNRMSMLAVKLRLTNQSRFTPGAAATASKKVSNLRPWETDSA
jgi:hypothetical protein